MKEPFDVSSFFTTLLRRGIGGKAEARVESHFWESASTASGLSAAEEAVSLFGGATGEEVYGWGTPSCRYCPEHLRDAAASLKSLGSEKLRLPGCFPLWE
jgi:hypothetical protein